MYLYNYGLLVADQRLRKRLLHGGAVDVLARGRVRRRVEGEHVVSEHHDVGPCPKRVQPLSQRRVKVLPYVGEVPFGVLVGLLGGQVVGVHGRREDFVVHEYRVLEDFYRYRPQFFRYAYRIFRVGALSRARQPVEAYAERGGYGVQRVDGGDTASFGPRAVGRLAYGDAVRGAEDGHVVDGQFVLRPEVFKPLGQY